MPATSIKQRRLMAIAEHDPDAVSAKNKAVTGMSKSQLSDFASTKEKELPIKRGYGAEKRSHHGRRGAPRGGG